jgi:hypothetical protein
MVWNETLIPTSSERMSSSMKFSFARGNLHRSARSSTCKKTLRDIMRVPVDPQYLQSLDFEGELRTIHAKVSEFKEVVGYCRADCYISPSHYARVTLRLRHLNCRVADLISSSRVKGDKLSQLEGFRDQIADLMQTATELHSNTTVVPKDPELPPVSHARNPPVTASVGTAPSEAPGPSSLGHHFQQPSGPCETGLHPTVSSQPSSVLGCLIRLKGFCPNNRYLATRLILSSPFLNCWLKLRYTLWYWVFRMSIL